MVRKVEKLVTQLPRQCKGCKKSLKGYHHAARWCCAACRDSHNSRVYLAKELRKGAFKGLPCPACGFQFHPRNDLQVYCTPGCKRDMALVKRRKKRGTKNPRKLYAPEIKSLAGRYEYVLENAERIWQYRATLNLSSDKKKAGG